MHLTFKYLLEDKDRAEFVINQLESIWFIVRDRLKSQVFENERIVLLTLMPQLWLDQTQVSGMPNNI